MSLFDGQIEDVRNPDEFRSRIRAVSEDDPRLMDSRDPLAHTHPEADVTGLLDDLDAKQARSERDQPSGYAGLDADALVIENPASATITPGASRIPVAGLSGRLDSRWIDSVEFDELKNNFQRLLLWVVQTFNQIPPGLEQALKEIDKDIYAH